MEEDQKNRIRQNTDGTVSVTRTTIYKFPKEGELKSMLTPSERDAVDKLLGGINDE